MGNKASASIKSEKYRTAIRTDNHDFIVDEPIEAEGKDLGPNPGELLSAALAACTAITMKMYAARKNWNLEEAIVHVDFERNLKENNTTFTKEIELIGDLSDEQKQRLFEIAERCPIHRTLANSIEIKSREVK
ncbi:MAG: OsmC family protein [Weeksellaceae bacterium]|jgi:putative redox protein|nr:OsmC family protein [Weeksellaceae bacterium]